MNTPEVLSLGEVAVMLGWTPRVVERLAAGGQLPATEIAGQWQFRREELIDWLDRKIQTLDVAQVADLEHKFESELQAAARRIRIAERLSPDLVRLDVQAPGRLEVLKELVATASRSGLVVDTAPLVASLGERETLCSTALPGGVAICHPRRPSPHLVRRTVLAAIKTITPVAFGAEDGEPTRLFFLIAALDDRAHLYALARLTRILHGGTLRTLLDASTEEAFIDAIRRRETEIDLSASAVTS